MNCFAITTSYRQTKIRAVHIIQTHDEWVHFVNIAFSEIPVNDNIVKISDLMSVIKKFYFSLCVFLENSNKIQYLVQ